jgi:hypothetical protein
MPAELDQHADAVVGWTGEAIMGSDSSSQGANDYGAAEALLSCCAASSLSGASTPATREQRNHFQTSTV